MLAAAAAAGSRFEKVALFILRRKEENIAYVTQDNKGKSELPILPFTTLTIIRKAGQMPRGTSSPGRTIFKLDAIGMLTLPAYENWC